MSKLIGRKVRVDYSGKIGNGVVAEGTSCCRLFPLDLRDERGGLITWLSFAEIKGLRDGSLSDMRLI